MRDKSMGMSAGNSKHEGELADKFDALRAALFRSMGVPGVYARTEVYEDVLQRLATLISRHRDPRAEVLRFPPVMSRLQVEKSGYLGSFPNLLGCVCALHGTEAEILAAANAHEDGGSWTESLAASDLVLSPAACYPAYPIAASCGAVPSGGLIFDVAADCFRREPSVALDRLQSFRMREYVRIGSPEEVRSFREQWIERAVAIAGQLGLPGELDAASDAFFGRVGQIMAVSQRQQSLKFEFLIPYAPGERPTACMSFNYHQDHFGLAWELRSADGVAAHSACVAFGMDRLTVAMFCIHGLDTDRWPQAVRQVLHM